jgi:hypothetical protein
VIKRKILLIIGILVSGSIYSQTQNDIGRINTVTTAVPFLRINPDARSGGMGDVGIATSADANATFFNPAKLVFSDKKLGLSLDYAPWLRNLGITDIFITHFAGYYKLDDYQALHTSFKFFSLGNITFTDYLGNINGQFNPRELALDVGYNRKLGKYVGLGVGLRYIYSNLASGQQVDNSPIKAGHAIGSDISFAFEKPISLKGDKSSVISTGLAITNIGSKISYTSDALEKDYIPTNLGVGVGYRFMPNKSNEIGIYADINKLMVPTPDTVDSDNNGILDFKEKSPIGGMFSSFADAPGGAKEEFKEFMYSTGLEYWYDKQFGARVGYFHEATTKGNRKYFTAGVSVKYSVFGLDFSYLVPTSNRRNPLDNTFRFSLKFDFDNIGKKVKSAPEEMGTVPVDEQ